MIKIAINGFGRIGRPALKVALEKSDQLEVVAVNDLADGETMSHLFKYDSVYGRFDGTVEMKGEEEMIVNGTSIKVLTEPDPSKLPWKELDVDIVLECTGVFRKEEDMKKHIDAGAKAVLLSAPPKGDGVDMYVKGVNDKDFDGKKPIFSSASCTTNCIAPVMAVLERDFGIAKASMTTIHAYTGDQSLVDGPHKDLRRARAAAVNIIPTTTGAAKATGKTIPALAKTFDGIAVRVPVPVGSLTDITALLKKTTTVEEVNGAFKKASEEEHFKGVLEVSEDPLVSSDIVGTSASSIVDLGLTTVVDGDLLKVIAWYDNEMGYTHRLIEQAIEASEIINKG